jgi:hypothetical protein
MEFVKEVIYCKNKRNQKIYGEIYIPQKKGPFPLLIFSHGYGYNMSYIEPEKLASKGIAVYQFDFCGGSFSSRSEGQSTEMSIMTEAEDLECVLDEMKNQNFIDKESIYLSGCSLGGVVSIIVGERRQNELKRSSTFHDFNIIGLKLKNKANKININDYNSELVNNMDNDRGVRKRGKTCHNKSKGYRNKEPNDNIKEDININNMKNKFGIRPVNTINNIKGILKNNIKNKNDNNNNNFINKKKSDFSYLNGEDDEEEEKEDENEKEEKKNFLGSLNEINESSSDDEDQANERFIENGKEKMNNIKAQNEDFINNQLNKNIKKENKYK